MLRTGTDFRPDKAASKAPRRIFEDVVQSARNRVDLMVALDGHDSASAEVRDDDVTPDFHLPPSGRHEVIRTGSDNLSARAPAMMPLQAVVPWPPNRPTLVVLLADDASARVTLHSPTGESHTHAVPLVEVALLAEGRVRNSVGPQHQLNAASTRLRVVDIAVGKADLRVVQRDQTSGVEVTSILRSPVPDVIRAEHVVTNHGDEVVRLLYVSSLSLTGFVSAAGVGLRGLTVHRADNSWCAEGRWQTLTTEAAGLVDIGSSYEGWRTSKSRYEVTGYGSWSAAGHVPMGAVTADGGRAWVWQVEHPGAWIWELEDQFDDLLLLASGPTDAEHQWHRVLAPGESFSAVPAALAVGEHLHDALDTLNSYRRTTRRRHQDHERLPVIFNDYMNCLMGDPRADQLRPLIDAAADVGCEYFVIDAGWYADDGNWWDTVGEWEPSRQRFPDGIETILDHIRNRGMIPGLWLEPEVVGVRSPLAERLPDDAFLRLRGRRVQENGRFHLDYRSPFVRERMDVVVQRLVEGLGVGYLKLDYNIFVTGSDSVSGGPGDGLLEHQRAFVAWLDAVLARYPNLVLENCASGAMRCDHAMLSRLALQSTSDQRDPLLTAPIAVAAPAAAAPEQAAVWAYPQHGMDDELASFCLVNAMLGRIHLSGRLDRMDERERQRVRAGLASYRSYRHLIPTAQPGWPLGLPGWYDDILALSLRTDHIMLVAVWFRGDEQHPVARLPLDQQWAGGQVEVRYPSDLETDIRWEADHLAISVPAAPAARLLHLVRPGSPDADNSRSVTQPPR